MNIKINYGTGVATLPTIALKSLDRATKADIKLLFLLCAEPYLMAGENRDACICRISERVGISVGQTESSLAFWRGAGVLDMDEEEETTPSPLAEESCQASETATPIAAETKPEPAAESAPAVPTVTVTRAKTRMLDEITNYSAEEMDKILSENQETGNFLNECQNVWGKIFNLHDDSLIIDLVKNWGFSWDYVLSLLAYVNKYFQERDNQGKTLSYVHRMAMSYHKEGILTVEALQEKFVDQDRMNEFEKRIRPMFGLGSRTLTPREKKYFSAWLYEYKYSIEIIEMAYNIAVDTKGTPQINYINGILKNWYEAGLTTLEEITAKREKDNQTVRNIKEGKLTPDNALENVESILKSESDTLGAPRSGNISQDINILRRIMNLGNRMLTEGEIAAFTKWRMEYGYRYEIIFHAYQINLENKREYSLPYMDAILTKWHDQKLTTLDAIRAYEKGYKEDKQKKKPSSSGNGNGAHPEGSFETEDFFAAAVKRSFGEDFDPSILN